jgi:hypothetical protein
VAAGDLVTTEEAAWVFRRAAELDAAVPGGPEALLDGRTVEAAGTEAGLSVPSLRQALDELRGGALVPAEPVLEELPARQSIVRTRAVPGPPAAVMAELEALARRNVLSERRRRGATTVWDRRPGVGAALRRSVPGRRARPLAVVGRLSATLGPVPGAPDLVRVELRADLVPARRLLRWRTKAGVATGVVTGAGMAAGAVVLSPFVPADLVLLVAGASGAGWAGTHGVRAARDARAALGDALAYALDRLEHRRTPELVLV